MMPVRIEGLTPDQILDLPEADFEELVLTGQPVAFRAGTAEVLGQFQVQDNRLMIELAHIVGGGEGVLLTIASLARSYARRRSLPEIEWVIYATNCAEPNPKLRRVLERRGFVVHEVEGKGECYHQIQRTR
jgi:hypothetical protein